MDIEFPASLRWVTYLAGGWPAGSESAMRRMADYFLTAASELRDTQPALSRVREETASVLFGETASAAEAQFSMLFDGDYSIDKLADAVAALGDLADTCALEIEYAKLWILSTLAIAAFEIRTALASAHWTGGGSLAAIPVVEAATVMSIRALVRALLERVALAVTSTLNRTMVKQLILKARQDVSKALAQDAGIQLYQVAHGHRDNLSTATLRETAIIYGAGGAVQKPTATFVSKAMGESGTVLTRAVKGALADAVASGAGRAVGIVASGGQPDAITVLGAAAKSSIKGGIQGASSRGATADRSS